MSSIGTTQNLATPQAIAALEDANERIQGSAEQFMIEILMGFLNKQQAWSSILSADAEQTAIDTMSSSYDTNSSIKAVQDNSKYQTDAADATTDNNSYNQLVQKAESALGSFTSAMAQNYRTQLPLQALALIMFKLLNNKKWMH
ncbi:MAG: hypothetical protein KGI80_03975 [Verrucomicrobiota bacterium]|nr:hypothetical protein [Verrucomicrobiota bacterium]